MPALRENVYIDDIVLMGSDTAPVQMDGNLIPGCLFTNIEDTYQTTGINRWGWKYNSSGEMSPPPTFLVGQEYGWEDDVVAPPSPAKIFIKPAPPITQLVWFDGVSPLEFDYTHGSVTVDVNNPNRCIILDIGGTEYVNEEYSGNQATWAHVSIDTDFIPVGFHTIQFSMYTGPFYVANIRMGTTATNLDFSLPVAPDFRDSVVNGDFETGDDTGWTETKDTGCSITVDEAYACPYVDPASTYGIQLSARSRNEQFQTGRAQITQNFSYIPIMCINGVKVYYKVTYVQDNTVGGGNCYFRAVILQGSSELGVTKETNVNDDFIYLFNPPDSEDVWVFGKELESTWTLYMFANAYTGDTYYAGDGADVSLDAIAVTHDEAYPASWECVTYDGFSMDESRIKVLRVTAPGTEATKVMRIGAEKKLVI